MAEIRIAAVVCAVITIAACTVPSDQISEPSFDVLERTILELQDAMADSRITARDLVEQYLARIQAYDRRGPARNDLSQ